MEKHAKKNGKMLALTLAALGVVYGDIGTSPLYALQVTLHGVPINSANVLGVLSLIFWALILVISTRYMNIILRADNDGEGGVLALLALLKRQNKKSYYPLFLIGILGTGLLLGDGMITPAISVISAIEGVKIIWPPFAHFIVPSAFVILLMLFLCQRFGTAKIGWTFGPIILLWFITIGCLGVMKIIQNPQVLTAVNPIYAVEFFRHNGWVGYLLLGGVFLVITGAEALYADLGHFGLKPIRRGWFLIVLPGLLLNYFGQGAYLLQTPSAITNPFFTIVPAQLSIAVLILATIATIIASQSIISASFSLTKQAILLNLCPRLSIIQTSEDQRGQIYVPQINFILAVGTLLLVLIFRKSESLAGMYGLAVNINMICVAILVIWVARQSWHWSIFRIISVFTAFTLIDFAFLGANLHKVLADGWVPLAFAVVCGAVMVTWQKGFAILRGSYYRNKGDFSEIISQLNQSQLCHPVGATAVFITDSYDQSGGSFLHYLKLNRSMPEFVLIVSMVIENYPYVAEKKRFEFTQLSGNICRLILHYGFMQMVNLPKTLCHGNQLGIFPFALDIEKTYFLVEMVNVTMTKRKYRRWFTWQKKLFSFLLRNSALDIEFFHLPFNRTIAIGAYCAI